MRAEFLSGSLKAARRRDVHEALAGGMADVVIGTHAVISEGVLLPRLGLAVVDEQHRFGVAQRAALQAKAGDLEPHVLALTATPIPRTMALTFYGDLAISTIRRAAAGPQADPDRDPRPRRAPEDRGVPRRRGGGRPSGVRRRPPHGGVDGTRGGIGGGGGGAAARQAAGAAHRTRPRPAEGR